MEEGTFVNLQNAREAEQMQAMERISRRGECPFCIENLRKEHKEPILREGRHWVLTPNQWPYANTRVHLLAISRKHAEKLRDLSPTAGIELWEICQWAEEEYQIESGALGLRFGDPAQNGGTVRHIHVQIIAAEITNRKDSRYAPIRFRVG